MVWKDAMMYEEVGLVSDNGKMEMKEGKSICVFNTRFFQHRADSRGWLHFNDPREIFIYLFQHFNSRFPRHFIFANFIQSLIVSEALVWEVNTLSRWEIDAWFRLE